jgi:hypothetical protein
MKKILILILLLFVFSDLSAQFLDGYDIYYGRQPSAKAEAMGRGLVANPSDDFASFYNPASTSFSEKIDVNFSLSDKYFSIEDASFNYEGINLNLKNWGNIGISRFYMGSKDIFNDYVDDDLSFTLYTLNYSRHIANNFFGGVNVNLINSHISQYMLHIGRIASENVMSASVDVGALKKIEFEKGPFENTSQMITLGAAIINVSNSTVHTRYYPYQNQIPIIGRIGGGYTFKILRNSFIDNTNALNLFVNLEYERELKRGRVNFYKLGGDATLFELLSLRGGVYYAHSYSKGDFYYTGGLGINIPFSKLTDGKYPFKLSIDYIGLKQKRNSDGSYDISHIVSMKLSMVSF